MNLIQVKGTFVAAEILLKAMGSLINTEQRVNAIQAKLKQDGLINGAYIRPIHFIGEDLKIPEDQVRFLVRGFDPETQLFSIELTTDEPFPEGCEVAMAYECIRTGEGTADIVGIYFAYLNNPSQMPYGHFEAEASA